MTVINKVSLAEPIDFAAEELKKYIRMMTPNDSSVLVKYAPAAKDGLRIGLLCDLGIDLPAGCDPALDDTVCIRTDGHCGIIGGSNPCAVLIAVYEFLRRNGCEWPAPGVDAELIPIKELSPVDYFHTPTMRIRGNCIEGALSQQMIEDFIDFMPKMGLNTFMIQFRNPLEFYRRYYNHDGSDDIRPPESISADTSIQWTRRLECEMERRGIRLHACGHGWTNAVIGVSDDLGWARMDDSEISNEYRPYVALVDGKRTFSGGFPTNTQFCMSNPEAQRRFVKAIADYSESHPNADYIHVWLADSCNNHCECEECAKHTPSDLYVDCMNMLDEELSARGLTGRIVLIVYVDTCWAPLTERLKNPDRFVLMIAPITRDYSRTLSPEFADIKPTPYVKNKLKMPVPLDEYLAYLREWKKIFDGECFAFEYHFWKHQHYDLSGIEMAKRIYEDTSVYLAEGVNGIMQCGSQRGFFPNGFAHYVHARAQLDVSIPYEQLEREYYSAAYGEEWERFRDALKRLSDNVPYEFLAAPKAAERPYAYVCPDMKPKIDELTSISDELKALANGIVDSPLRARSLMGRLLLNYAEYVRLLAIALGHKVVGEHDAALAAYEDVRRLLVSLERDLGAYNEFCQKHRFIRHALTLRGQSEISFSSGE